MQQDVNKVANIKVSVIIPYKNSEKWIKRCADSLTKQKGNFEFLFVNDHSEENEMKVLEQYDDDRFRLLWSIPVEGVSAARNTGLDEASGEWVTFLDADDELLPDAYLKYMRMIQTDALIHQANHLRCYVKKKVTLHKWVNPDGMYVLPALPEMWAPVWNKLYKADLVKGIRFREGYQFGEDEIFNLECFSKAGVVHNMAVDIMKHNLENTGSLAHVKTDRDVIKLFEAVLDMIPDESDPKMRTALFNNMVLHFHSKWVIDMLTK